MSDPVVTLEETLEWLRQEPAVDDLTITTLIAAASEWARATADLWNGTLPAPDRVRLAVLALVADWYGNRETTSVGNSVVTPLPNGPQFLVGHLRALDV